MLRVLSSREGRAAPQNLWSSEAARTSRRRIAVLMASMSIARCAVSLVASLLATTVVACGGSGSGVLTDSTTQQTVGLRPPPWDVKTECPKQIAILDRPNCRLISRRQRLVSCPAGTVGHDVRAAGISCKDVYALLSPLGGSAGFGVFNRARQQLARPAVATYSPPFEIRATGWTCWADFMLDRSYGEQFVCWRGRAVLTFKFS